MDAMRESWTDDRLDDLNGKVDAFRLETRTEFAAVRAEVKEEFAAVRAEMKAEFAAVRAEMRQGFAKIDSRFESMDQRLLDTYRMMMGFCGLMLAAIVGLIVTQI